MRASALGLAAMVDPTPSAMKASKFVNFMMSLRLGIFNQEKPVIMS